MNNTDSIRKMVQKELISAQWVMPENVVPIVIGQLSSDGPLPVVVRTYLEGEIMRIAWELTEKHYNDKMRRDAQKMLADGRVTAQQKAAWNNLWEELLAPPSDEESQ